MGIISPNLRDSNPCDTVAKTETPPPTRRSRNVIAAQEIHCPPPSHATVSKLTVNCPPRVTQVRNQRTLHSPGGRRVLPPLHNMVVIGGPLLRTQYRIGPRHPVGANRAMARHKAEKGFPAGIQPHHLILHIYHHDPRVATRDNFGP